MIQKLSIIIPVFNEAKTVHLILDKIKKVELLNDSRYEGRELKIKETTEF